MTDLISTWRALPLESPPLALPADIAILADSKRYAVPYTDWKGYLEAGLEKGNDSRFHLGLIPQPFFGDLAEATVFVLMLNPGLSPGDYFGEYNVPTLRSALISNLRQEANRRYPLLFLDPEFSWHPGARYFRARLGWLALAISKEKSLPYAEALSLVAKNVCVIQLVPYHSVKFSLPRPVLGRLESSALAKTFVRERVLTRPDAVILVTRQSSQWGSPRGANVITYEGSETRAALISPKSPSGRALTRHFGLTPTT